MGTREKQTLVVSPKEECGSVGGVRKRKMWVVKGWGNSCCGEERVCVEGWVGRMARLWCERDCEKVFWGLVKYR